MVELAENNSVTGEKNPSYVFCVKPPASSQLSLRNFSLTTMDFGGRTLRRRSTSTSDNNSTESLVTSCPLCIVGTMPTLTTELLLVCHNRFINNNLIVRLSLYYYSCLGTPPLPLRLRKLSLVGHYLHTFVIHRTYTRFLLPILSTRSLKSSHMKKV